MPDDSEQHRRRSIRLKEYDYSSDGWYFVTICVQKRECVLGHVSKGDIVLSQIGRIVKECWEWLPQQYPYVGLDEWVIMPNHLHGIIIINGGKKGGSRTAPTELLAIKSKFRQGWRWEAVTALVNALEM